MNFSLGFRDHVGGGVAVIVVAAVVGGLSFWQ